MDTTLTEARRIGRRVAEARRAVGLTQVALSSAASIERTALSKVEHGRRRVGSDELARIARALGRPIDWFVTEPAGIGRLESLHAKRRQILRAAARHGARRVRVFGSVARGQARRDSDLDLLVDFEPGRTLLDQAALRIDLESLLGMPVDVVTAAGLRGDIRTQVLVEAVPL